jgi:hypothetical protein
LIRELEAAKPGFKDLLIELVTESARRQIRG